MIQHWRVVQPISVRGGPENMSKMRMSRVSCVGSGCVKLTWPCPKNLATCVLLGIKAKNVLAVNFTTENRNLTQRKIPGVLGKFKCNVNLVDIKNKWCFHSFLSNFFPLT